MPDINIPHIDVTVTGLDAATLEAAVRALPAAIGGQLGHSRPRLAAAATPVDQPLGFSPASTENEVAGDLARRIALHVVARMARPAEVR